MTKRKDGRYQIQVDLGYENGKRIRKTVYGNSPKEVKQNADALRLLYGKGIKDLDITLNQWKKLFLNKEKFQTTDTNYKAKSSKLTIFENKIGKETKMIEIKPYMVSNFLCTLVSDGRSKKTIKEYKSVLNQLFRYAFVNNIIPSNPMDYVEIPVGKEKKPRRALTKEEQERLAKMPDFYPGKAMALTCMWAGLRRGEATALLWSDIDFKNNTIRVNKSWDFNGKKLKETKTQAGMRLVPLLPCLADYLKTLPKNSPYVFGKRLEQWDWHRELAHILRYLEKEYGNPKATPKTYKNKYTIVLTIPYFTWHELRHTYCTILYDNDIPLKVAQTWMGHKSQEMTAEIYSHLSNEKEQAAKQAILQFGSQMVVNGSVFSVDT